MLLLPSSDDEQANELTAGIAGGPDNRNFHKRVSDCQNLMLVKRGAEKKYEKWREKIVYA